jgi:hypothetical protein
MKTFAAMATRESASLALKGLRAALFLARQAGIGVGPG